MAANPMTSERLGEIITEHADEIHQHEGNYWQFDYFGFQLIALTDPTSNRMRIMSPIAALDGLEDAVLLECLAANFDRALDARFATNQGLLWSVFIHTLSDLHDEQIVTAINQVARLSATFGSTFTSSDLSFG